MRSFFVSHWPLQLNETNYSKTLGSKVTKNNHISTNAFFFNWGKSQHNKKGHSNPTEELPFKFPPSIEDLRPENPPIDEVYVPEVSTDVSINEDVLRAYSAKGSTSVTIENINKVVTMLCLNIFLLCPSFLFST